MSDKPRPRLSLKVSDPPASTTPGSGKPSIKLRLPSSASKASTPVEPRSLAASPSTVKKASRARKPSAKVLAANANGKREHSETDDDTIPTHPPAKIKISFTKPPSTPVGVKLKLKGKPPKRPLGEGYDSEASDIERDPSIEEQFIIRFDDKLIAASGADCADDCAYVHKMIEEKKIGAGAEIQLCFHERDGRRAWVKVRQNLYAATLVDMPTITESMKSFDKRTWMKTADVSQMLLVFAKIKKNEEAKKIELPRVVDNKTYEFPHGLTPPMRFARHRRFRARTRRNDIEEVEREVNRLLHRDTEVMKSTFEWYDEDATSRDGSRAFTEDADENADAEGEIDDSFVDGSAIHDQNGLGTNGDGDEVNLEDELDAAFAEDLGEAATPATEAATPIIEVEASTPVAIEEEEAESEDDSGDEEDDDEGEEEMDDEARAKQAAIAEQQEDIAEIEKLIEELTNQHREMKNPIIKERLSGNLENAKSELILKKARIEALGGES